MIDRIEAARADALDITADMYTYTTGATGLNAEMPPWVQEGGFEAFARPALHVSGVSPSNHATAADPSSAVMIDSDQPLDAVTIHAPVGMLLHLRCGRC